MISGDVIGPYILCFVLFPFLHRTIFIALARQENYVLDMNKLFVSSFAVNT